MFGWLSNLFSSSKPGSKRYAVEIMAEGWEAYKAARRERPRDNYQPHRYSGNAAILSSHDMLHRRVRDMARNVAQVKRIDHAMTNLVVGNGVQTFAYPFAPHELFQLMQEVESIENGSLGPRLAWALESDDLFEQWFNDPKQFDAEGRLSGADIQRMQLSETVKVGNGLLIRCFKNDPSRLVPLCYQLIEREQLDESNDRPASKGTNQIVGGIEINKAGQAVAYHLYSDHPHDSSFGGPASNQFTGPFSQGSEESNRIPASRVINLSLFDRPSSTLGISWLDAVAETTFDRSSYTDSEIRSAALQAVFALVHKMENADKGAPLGFDDDLDDTDSYGNDIVKLGSSPVASYIKPNEDVEMVGTTRPNKDAAPFIKLLDHDTAGGVGLSYYTLTGDYSDTNFSSTRAAKLDEDGHIRPLQQWFGTHQAVPIRREFNRIAASMGLFKTLSPGEFRRSESTYQRFDAIGPGRELLDPFKEGEARTARMRTGMSTFKEECARAGKHWIRVLTQQAIEKRVFELLDVKPDFTKAGNGDMRQQQAEELAEVGDDE